VGYPTFLDSGAFLSVQTEGRYEMADPQINGNPSPSSEPDNLLKVLVSPSSSAVAVVKGDV
jgi:hypothetical protein